MNNRELLFIIKVRNASAAAFAAFRRMWKGVAADTRAAMVGMAKYNSNLAKLGTTARTTAAQLKKVTANGFAARINQQMQSARASMAALGKQALNLRGILAGFGALFIGRAIIDTLVGFGDEMAKVKAISGATADEFEALEAKAKELGASTRFTATQAAEGLTFLSRAGFDATESINALRPSLNLAQVGVLTLGKSADIMSNIMATFSINTKEASKVADVLAFTASRSNTTVQQMGQAIKFVGPIARSLGFDLNSVSAAIGALGNAGIQTTLAGAGLRIAFQRLLNPTDQVVDSIKALGLTVDDLDPAKLGNSLESVLEKLKEAEKAVGSGEFGRELTTIFSARGSTTVLALINQIEKFRELNIENRKAGGFAQELAKIMDATLGGALKALQSAMQDTVIGMGNGGLGGALEGLVRGVTSVIRSVGAIFDFLRLTGENTEFVTNVFRTLGKVMTIVAAVLGTKFLASLVLARVGFIRLGVAMISATLATKKLTGAMRLLRAAFKANPIGLILEGITLLVIGYELLKDTTIEYGNTSVNVSTLVRFVWEKVASVLLHNLNVMKTLVRVAASLVTLDWDGAKAAIDDFGKEFSKNMEDMTRSLEEFKARDAILAMEEVADKNSELTAAAREAGDGVLRLNDELRALQTTAEGLAGSYAPGVAATRAFAEAQKELNSLLRRSNEELKLLGFTRADLASIQAGLNRQRKEEADAILVTNNALREEAKLIGLVGVAKKIAAARAAAEEAALVRDPAGGGKINEDTFAKTAALLRGNAQKALTFDIKKTIEAQNIEIANIGKTKDEVDRLTEALRVMEKAREAGYDPADVKRFGEEAVRSFDRIKEAQDAWQADGRNGIRKAMDDYIAESKRFADKFETLTKGAIDSVGDAFGEFVTTGKLDFLGLVQSIANDISKLGAEIISAKLFEAISPTTKEPAGSVVGKAGGLLGVETDPIVKATEEASKNIKDGGLVTGEALQEGARTVNSAFESVGTVIQTAGQTNADKLTQACQLMVNAIQECADQLKDCGPGGPGAAPTPIRDNLVTDRATTGGLGDADDFFGEESLVPFAEQARTKSQEFASVLSENNKQYRSALERAVADTTETGSIFNSDFLSSLNSITDQLVSGADGLLSSLFSSGSAGGSSGSSGISSLFSGIAGAFSSSSGANAGGIDPSLFAFAKGGVMSARGSQRLRSYANGGIADKPQIAVFGEGDKPEAFVPLPDGRRIPVEMSGTPAQRPVTVNVNQTITTPDPSAFGRNQDQIARKGAMAFQRAMARDN